MTDETPEEKMHRMHYIRNLYAFDLFCQHRFEESLKIFDELGTGLSQYSMLSTFCCTLFKFIEFVCLSLQLKTVVTACAL